MRQPKIQDYWTDILCQVIATTASTCCVGTRILLMKGKTLALVWPNNMCTRKNVECQYQARPWFETLGANP